MSSFSIQFAQRSQAAKIQASFFRFLEGEESQKALLQQLLNGGFQSLRLCFQLQFDHRSHILSVSAISFIAAGECPRADIGRGEGWRGCWYPVECF